MPPTNALSPAIAGSETMWGDPTARHGCGPTTTLARFGARTRRRSAFAAKPSEGVNAAGIVSVARTLVRAQRGEV